MKVWAQYVLLGCLLDSWHLLPLYCSWACKHTHTDIRYLMILYAFFWCSLFPLLQLYDKNVSLSIAGYFGVIRSINQHQDQLPACPTGSQDEIEQVLNTYPEWVSIHIPPTWCINSTCCSFSRLCF